MKLELNGKALFEALIGYGEYGDGQLEEGWRDRQEFLTTLKHKIDVISSLYDQLDDVNINHDIDVDVGVVGDIWNFLLEFHSQLVRRKTFTV